MHYSAVAVIEAHGPDDVRRAIAAGEHLSTLAFSETGSRSHFWAPLGTAARAGDDVVLDASKSWVTSAGEADSYVWTSQPTTGGPGASLWLVPSATAGLEGRRAVRRPRPAGQRLEPGAGVGRVAARRRPASATTAPASTSPSASCCRCSRSSTRRAASA